MTAEKREKWPRSRNQGFFPPEGSQREQWLLLGSDTPGPDTGSSDTRSGAAGPGSGSFPAQSGAFPACSRIFGIFKALALGALGHGGMGQNPGGSSEAGESHRTKSGVKEGQGKPWIPNFPPFHPLLVPALPAKPPRTHSKREPTRGSIPPSLPLPNAPPGQPRSPAPPENLVRILRPPKWA